jgi:phage shock protein A
LPIKSIDILDPTSEVSRFEEKIRREEARSSSDGRR